MRNFLNVVFGTVHKCKMGSLGVFFLPPRLAEILLMVSQSVYGMVVSSVLWRAK